MNYYIADVHFGHENVIKFDNRPFKNVEEMDSVLIENWNARVKDEDNVYILGDFCYRAKEKPSWYLKRLNGKKHFIQGNHDKRLLQDKEAVEQLESIEKMQFVKDGENTIVLCHFPIAEWNGFFRRAWHIYGHIHGKCDETFRYMKKLERALNAGCMLNEYQPVTFRELVENNRRFIIEKEQDLIEEFKQGRPFWHYCEVCGKKELLTVEEAFDEGWDYPPTIGEFGVISQRICGDCCMMDSLYWKQVVGANSESSGEISETIQRIKNEPFSLVEKV